MNLGERVSLRRKSVPVKSGIPPPNDCKSVVYMLLKQTQLFSYCKSVVYIQLVSNDCTSTTKSNTVKPAHEVTSIKQSPVLKGHLFLVLS